MILPSLRNFSYGSTLTALLYGESLVVVEGVSYAYK